MPVVQWNLGGASAFGRAWWRHPELLMPHLSVPTVADVPFAALHARGFQGVVFDKDNTLTVPHAHDLAPQFQSALEICTQVFGQDRVVVFSNTAGAQGDVDFHKAEQLEQQLGLAVLRHHQKKPAGIEAVMAFFDSVAPQKLIMIGDRYATDVLFGNQHGLLTVRTDQFTTSGEHAMNVWVQRMEKAVIARLQRQGYAPPKHPMYPTLEKTTNT